jgi:hypothetical protein
MAERLDVTERLAEGRPAVEHTQSYVRACQLLGYHDPELTLHPDQIRDWYDSEDGLDLRALDGDCAQLRAAAAAVMEALRMQRAQVDELAAAWTGPGAESAVAFLQRHCDAANTAATEVRAAAPRCESLRDNLWHLVDVKVATSIAIDDRTLAHRPAWLAAATAVTTGAGDRRTANELIEQQIKPYVDNDIRTDWLTAMRSTRAGIAASYDMVIDRFAAAAPAYFESPEDLRPGPAPFLPAPASAPAATVAVAPAAAFPTGALDPPPPAIPATPTSPTSVTPTTTREGLALAPPTSELGAGLGDASAMPAGAGSSAGLDGLGGLASRIVDALSGLLGSAGEQLNDPAGLDDPFDTEDPFDPNDNADDNADNADDNADNADHDADSANNADESDAEPEKPEEIQTIEAEEAKPVDAPPPAGGPPPPIDGPPPATIPPPVAAAPPAAAPPSGGKTPCEIAADELPKAGQ